MNLRNKKLLMMGGSAYFRHIRDYADQQGFEVVAVGNNPNASYYAGADRAYPYSTTDVENVIRVVEKEKIDGIFVGAQEANMLPAIEVAERTGAFFYAQRDQWNVLSDKARFKQLCRDCGVPVVPEFPVANENDTELLTFPVLLKPVDGSGGHGMNVCSRKEDFPRYYHLAMENSRKKQVIVEKLMSGAKEVFFQYTLQEGMCSLTSAFTKVFSEGKNKEQILPLFHMYPSGYIDEYYHKLHEQILRLFRTINLQNGVITIQSFYLDGEFYVFEAGYRMGGAQNYIFSDYQNGTNSLHYMVNYALTGRMCDQRIESLDNPRFTSPCCNYYVGLLPGTIAFIPDARDLAGLPGVLNITPMRKAGDVIEDTNSLDRICLRLHMTGQNEEELAENLVRVCNAIRVVSTDGADMVMEKLIRERCLKAIRETVGLSGQNK